MSHDLGELGVQAEQRKAAREAARQGVPPSRVGTKLKPVSLTSAEAPTDAPAAPEAPQRVVRSIAPASAPAKPQEAAGALVKTTIHLGSGEDSFLEQVRFAGRSVRPKVDASRSAVARLAIARLAEQLSPDEIVAELTKRGPAVPAAAGRKRY